MSVAPLIVKPEKNAWDERIKWHFLAENRQADPSDRLVQFKFSMDFMPPWWPYFLQMLLLEL